MGPSWSAGWATTRRSPGSPRRAIETSGFSPSVPTEGIWPPEITPSGAVAVWDVDRRCPLPARSGPCQQLGGRVQSRQPADRFCARRRVAPGLRPEVRPAFQELARSRARPSTWHFDPMASRSRSSTTPAPPFAASWMRTRASSSVRSHYQAPGPSRGVPTVRPWRPQAARSLRGSSSGMPQQGQRKAILEGADKHRPSGCLSPIRNAAGHERAGRAACASGTLPWAVRS